MSGGERHEQAVDDQSRSYRHGIHTTLGLLAGQWETDVLASLMWRPMSYTALLDHINHTAATDGWTNHQKPLRDKVLSDTLERMRRDGLIVKTERPTQFGNTSYDLTNAGRALLRALRPLAAFAKDHGAEVTAAREAYHRD